MQKNTTYVLKGRWMKSATEHRTFTNGKGDKVSFFDRTHAIINGEHFYTHLSIYAKVQELNARQSF